MGRFSTSLMALLFLAALLVCGSVSAQGSLVNFGKGSTRKGQQGPTTITANSMDIDVANNIATFIGNVEVDDPEMNIKCHKMIIYMEDKKEEDRKEEDEESEFGKKQITRVECIGDVVIVRKVKGESGKLDESQKALAGKAEYDLKAGGRITLEEDPVIIRGKDRIRGDTIILYRDSERMQILGKGSIKTAGEEGDGGQEKPKDEAPKKDDASQQLPITIK